MYNKFYASIEIPDGWYMGKWGGCRITFDYDDKEVMIETTTIGVRGMNITCQFNVKDGHIVEESIKAVK